jgi:hypothetical protein
MEHHSQFVSNAGRALKRTYYNQSCYAFGSNFYREAGTVPFALRNVVDRSSLYNKKKVSNRANSALAKHEVSLLFFVFHLFLG